MVKVECPCGNQVAALHEGRCWFCWQTGVVQLEGISVVLLAFLHPERRDVDAARKFFPRLLEGAEESIEVELHDDSVTYMSHFEIASYPNYASVCEKGSRSEKIVLSLRHLNPDWSMSTTEMKWRLAGSSLCKECKSFDKEDCETCKERCVGTLQSGKRCRNPRAGKWKKSGLCRVRHH